MDTLTKLQSQVINTLNDRYLNLIILPTEKCNFRCTYCYEDFAIGKMSSTVQNAIINLLRKRLPKLNILEISWFGGEPLLAKEVIYNISKFILREKPEKLKFSANLTTNAYQLNEEIFAELINCNVNKYQISLDGDIDLHNKSRVLANGVGTFQKIWDNLVMMHNSNYEFELIIRVHFTIDNYKEHESLIRLFNRHLSHDRRIKIYFKAIERLGGANDAAIKQLRHTEKKEIKEYLDAMILDKQQLFNLSSDDTPYICYASKPNSLMIRANGKLGKCTVALNNEKNDIGFINEFGELQVNGNLKYWMEGLETLDLQTLACPLSKIDTTIKASEK